MRRLGRIVVRLIITVCIAAPVVFFTVEQLPGDAASASIRTTSAAVLEQRRSELGLDQAPLQRFWEWISALVTGDLGHSSTTGVPVVHLIALPLRNSSVLALSAGLVAVVLGVAVGLASGLRPRSTSARFAATVVAIVVATPEFVIAIGLCLVGAVWWRILPAVSLTEPGVPPWETPQILVLPVASAGLVGAAVVARLSSGIIAAEAARPHVEAARMAGLSVPQVLWRHLLPGARAPFAQVVAALVPYLVGGTLVIENVFGYPGMGSLMVSTIAARDSTTVSTMVMVLVVLVAVTIAIADLAAPSRATSRELRAVVAQR